jgi:hypothetical protein
MGLLPDLQGLEIRHSAFLRGISDSPAPYYLDSNFETACSGELNTELRISRYE